MRKRFDFHIAVVLIITLIVGLALVPFLPVIAIIMLCTAAALPVLIKMVAQWLGYLSQRKKEVPLSKLVVEYGIVGLIGAATIFVVGFICTHYDLLQGLHFPV